MCFDLPMVKINFFAGQQFRRRMNKCSTMDNVGRYGESVKFVIACLDVVLSQTDSMTGNLHKPHSDLQGSAQCNINHRPVGRCPSSWQLLVSAY
ncbi:hypothetical protein MSAN_01054600 [Mycena sanguinolenta]|uniref:Uncharacterized protein n=1 Tax=Mycena sanguinolenta TaxID=230812 RepID=A0A8H6YRQ2_9AGAR|nr:hypothetical protein MSAN_01054600 [Mycena sanguinolenta]